MTTSGCWFFIAVASNVILVVRQVVSGFRIPASSLFIQKFKTSTIWRCWRNRKVFAYYSISSLAVLKKKILHIIFGICLLICSWWIEIKFNTQIWSHYSQLLVRPTFFIPPSSSSVCQTGQSILKDDSQSIKFQTIIGLSGLKKRMVLMGLDLNGPCSNLSHLCT